MKKIKDHYFHKAKRDGYVARSAYKLEEIDKKHLLLRKGNMVLDLGCSPGSWIQYAVRKVGEHVSARNIKINYPLIGAAGYSGLMVWHGGISGSAPIIVYLPLVLPFSTDSKIKLFFSASKNLNKFSILL